MVYANKFGKPFPIFVRAVSKAYFDKIRCLFNIKTKDEFAPIIDAYKKGDQYIPCWEGHSVNPGYFMNFDKLATEL